MFDFGRVLSRVYNQLFGNLEFKELNTQLNVVKSTIKRLIKLESKLLKISPTGKLRLIELVSTCYITSFQVLLVQNDHWRGYY